MHSLDLNLLAALDALLQEGSVVGAAERLHLTPPAMSRALGRLRDALGDPLFVRAGRGLVPTPRARALRERVHAALAEASTLLAPELPARPEELRRSFSVRADDAVVAALGPALLARIASVARGVSVVFVAEGDESVDDLREGRVDLDLGVQGALAPEIRVRKLFDDQRVVLLEGSRQRRKLTLQQLADRPHVDISRRGLLRGPLDDALAIHGLSRRVAAVVPTHLAAAVLVAGSDAVSLVSEQFAAAVSQTLDVHAVPCPLPLPAFSVAMAWHPRFDADVGHRFFRTEVAALALALAKARSGGR